MDTDTDIKMSKLYELSLCKFHIKSGNDTHMRKCTCVYVICDGTYRK